MILFDFAVVYWFCCYDELRWEAPDREKGEDLGRMPRYAASRATDAIARASEKWRRFGADAAVLCIRSHQWPHHDDVMILCCSTCDDIVLFYLHDPRRR